MSESPPRTPDGRYVVIAGRRWRATDPAIPDRFVTELTAELMAARRAVRAREDGARARVQDAKLALGERGEAWWEPTPDGRARRLEATVRTLLRHRRPDATICPSDAARVVGGTGWRAVVPEAQQIAAQLRADGIVRITQRGADVDPQDVRGPVRIARGPRFA